jgi:hypothetical protein
MNTQKSVFNKISKIEKVEDKVELSELQRIEFALVDELEKAVDAIQDDSNKANKWAKDYDVIVGNALKAARASIQGYIKKKPLVGTGKFAEGLIDNAIRQGKELGVDMSKNMSVKRLQNSLQSLESATKLIDKIESDAQEQAKKLR